MGTILRFSKAAAPVLCMIAYIVIGIVIGTIVNGPVNTTTIEVDGKMMRISYSEKARWLIPTGTLFGANTKSPDAPLFGGRIMKVGDEIKREACWVGGPMGGSVGCALIPASEQEEEMWRKSPLNS